MDVENFMVSTKTSDVFTVTIPPSYIDGRIHGKAKEMLNMCYQGKCRNSVLVNFNNKSFEDKKILDNYEVYNGYNFRILVNYEAITIDVSSQPELIFVIESMVDLHALCSNVYIKAYMPYDNFTGFSKYVQDNGNHILRSEDNKELSPGKKVIIKINQIGKEGSIDKEPSFIGNGIFIKPYQQSD